MITSYEALDLGRYMQIDRILHTPQEDIDKQVQIVAVLANLTEEEVLHLPLPEYSAMAAKSAFLGAPCPASPADGSPVEAGGLRLLPTKDFTKITTAQYVDFQTFAKDFPRTLPELLSCFLLPEGKAYNEGYDPADVQEAVRSLPLPAALGLSAFFLTSYIDSIAATLHYLESPKRTKKMNPEQRAKIAEARTEAERALRLLGAGLPA